MRYDDKQVQCGMRSLWLIDTFRLKLNLNLIIYTLRDKQSKYLVLTITRGECLSESGRGTLPTLYFSH